MSDIRPFLATLLVSECPKPQVSATKKECERCHQPVWVSNRNGATSKSCEIICVICLRKHLEAKKKAMEADGG